MRHEVFQPYQPQLTPVEARGILHKSRVSPPQLIFDEYIRNRPRLPEFIVAEDDHSAFLTRFEQLRPRIEQLIKGRWGSELDAFETDNLIQAAFVHLWEGYTRRPNVFDERGDGYWYAAAKQGAFNEFVGEFRQRYRQQGSGAKSNRKNVEVLVSAGDILAARSQTIYSIAVEADEPDETVLTRDTAFTRELHSYQEVDNRIDLERLIRAIYQGTAPKDHPLISQILDWMQDGLSLNEMARTAGVKVATIKCAVRRIRQACGAVQSAKDNKRNGYGDTKDEHIRKLFARGVKAPEIARLIGSNHKFVYSRLHALNLME